MAERRMFAKKIIDSDDFLDMPLSTQALYFHLCMRADDDGFTASARRVVKTIDAKDDDLKLLFAKNFIIPFETGIVVIKHWKIHNYIAKDRYKETMHIEEKAQLSVEDNNVYSLYTECSTPCIPSIGKVSIGKSSIEKESIDNVNSKKEIKHKYGEHNNILLTDQELEKLKEQFDDWQEKIENISEGVAMKGYKYKSHYLAILKWAKNEKTNKQATEKKSSWKEKEDALLGDWG